MKWYAHPELLESKRKCDEATKTKNLASLYSLSDIYGQIGHDDTYSDILKAAFLYSSFTCLSDWIEFSVTDEEKSSYSSMNIALEKYEAEFEKCLYLCRKAQLHLSKYSDEVSFDDILEEGYYNALYCSLIVNFSNILSRTGRLINSIDYLLPIADLEFAMGLGNLGNRLASYADFIHDGNEAVYVAKLGLDNLNRCLQMDSTNMYAEARNSFDKRASILKKKLGESTTLKYEDILSIDLSSVSGEERDYRDWCANNGLYLTHANDAHRHIDVAFDPIHLPPMRMKEEDGIIPTFHGLFNQIKQAYVSARFMVFEGLEHRETHLSDKYVYLVNTLDYPVYGLGIEKIKSAYRSIYSIFDHIAYFLNSYFELGFKENRIFFKRIWDKKILRDKVKSNYALRGLYWMRKDLANISVSSYKEHIDPVLSKISEIRQAMEHRYFKVHEFEVTDIEDTDENDRLAFSIGFEDFERYALTLLSVVREAILLLGMTVYIEEHAALKNTGQNTLIVDLPLTNYEDDWKAIQI